MSCAKLAPMLVLCLIFLAAQLTMSTLLVGNPVDMEVLFPQGNEYRQAQELFAKTTRLNATDYFMDLNGCLLGHPKPHVCMKFANKFHREFSNLWQPKSQTAEAYPRKLQDCTYTIANFTLMESSPQSNLFSFKITQHNCTSGTYLLGGAAFEVFAVGTSALGSCSVIDHMNDKYDVICSVPVTPYDRHDVEKKGKAHTSHGSKEAPPPLCLNITAVLMYEHFDGFSEVLLDWSHLYPPLRSVLADNALYCVPRLMNSHGGGADAAAEFHAQPFSLHVPPSVHWHSGLWLRSEVALPAGDARYMLDHHQTEIWCNSTALSNPRYQFSPASGNAAYLYHTYQKLLPNNSALSNITLRTMTTLSMQNPHETADRYSFQPLLLVQGGKLPTSLTVTKRQHSHNTKDPAVDIRSNSFCLSKGWDLLVCQRWSLLSDGGAASWNGDPAKSHRHGSAHHHFVAVDDRAFLRNFTYGTIIPFNITYPVSVNATVNATAVMAAEKKRLKHQQRMHVHQQELQHQPGRQRRLNSKHAHHHKNGDHHLTEQEKERARMQFHFVGASHMRYIFDAVSEFFFGMEVLENVPRKHDELPLANLKYNFIAHARHQVPFLSKLCASLQNDTHATNATVRERTHTLIFQTGAWDLSVGSLRRILKDPTVGKRLMFLFDGILTGRHPCGRVKHVVWLTSMPHRVCFEDGAVECNAQRSFRINSAIAAVNHFYLQHLFRFVTGIENDPELHEQQRDGALPRLSVVDAFNIIKPRLVFNERSEAVCNNHFSCRLGSFNNIAYADGYLTVLVHSPGGMAVAKSVMNALSM